MKAEQPGAVASPFQFFVSVSKLPQNGMPVRFEATDDERTALALHLGILEVEALNADLLVKRWKRDGVLVEGTLKARIVQACVVSLDPVGEDIDEPVDLVFVPEGSKLARIQTTGEGELHLDPDGADIPETFIGDKIDLGSFMSETIALAMDPYPRSSEADFEEWDTDPNPTDGKVSPFSALQGLRTQNPPDKD